MDNYTVLVSPQALREIDAIYEYIATNFQAPTSAERVAEAIEEAIFSLEQFPGRGALRKVGKFASQGYRQLFVRDYIIIYRVDPSQKQVLIITVQHGKRDF